MLPKYDATLLKIAQGVVTSQRLEKIASDFTGDREVLEKASALKIAVDAETFALIKQSSLANELGRKALGGMAVGTGVALPAVLGGTYLLDRASDETKETTEDIRNKVLQTALGVGGIGAGLYGLHRLSGGDPISLGEKRSSYDENHAEELVEKLAAVGLIEDELSQLDKTNLSEDAQKLAAEVMVLNRGYGMQLLYEASHK